MSTDPPIRQPDEPTETSDLEDRRREGETDGDRKTDSEFQKFVDEAGRRFREALDRLA